MRHASWVHQKSSTFEHEFFVSVDPTRKLNSLTSNKAVSSIVNQQNKINNIQKDNNNTNNNLKSYQSLQELIEYKHPEVASPKAETIAEVVFQSQENCNLRKRIQGIQEWRNSLNKSKPTAQMVCQEKQNEIIQALIQDHSQNQPQIFNKKINSLQSPYGHIKSINSNGNIINENGNLLSQRSSSKKADNYFHGHFSSQIDLNPCSETTRRSLTNVLYPSLSPVKPRQNNQLNFPISQPVYPQQIQSDVQNSQQNSKVPQQYVKYLPRSQYSLPETSLTSQQQQISQQFLSSQQLQNSYAKSPRVIGFQQSPSQRITSQSTGRRISPAKLCNMVNVEINIEEKSDLNQARLTRAMSKLKRSVHPMYHSEDKKVAGFAPGAVGNRSKNQDTNISYSKGISVQGDHQSLSPRRIVVNKTENFMNERKESFLRIKREICTESNNDDPNYLTNNLESNNTEQIQTLPYTKYLKTSKEWGVFRRTNQNSEQNFQSKFDEYQSTNPTTTTTSTTPTVSSGLFQTQIAQQPQKSNQFQKRQSKNLSNKGSKQSLDKKMMLLPPDLSFVRLSAWDNSFQRKNDDQDGNDDLDLLQDYSQPSCNDIIVNQKRSLK